MNELNEKFDHLANSLEIAHHEIKTLKATLNKTTETNKKLMKDVEKLQNDITLLKKNNTDMDERIDYLSDQSRRDNLIFTKINEDKDENWEQSEKKVMDFIDKHMKVNVKIERAHRVGPKDRPNKPGPRNIVAKFSSWKDRELVFQKRRDLDPEESFVRIREDLCPGTTKAREKELPKLLQAREAGHRAYYSYRKVVVKPGYTQFGRGGRDGASTSAAAWKEQSPPPAAHDRTQYPNFPKQHVTKIYKPKNAKPTSRAPAQSEGASQVAPPVLPPPSAPAQQGGTSPSAPPPSAPAQQDGTSPSAPPPSAPAQQDGTPPSAPPPSAHAQEDGTPLSAPPPSAPSQQEGTPSGASLGAPLPNASEEQEGAASGAHLSGQPSGTMERQESAEFDATDSSGFSVEVEGIAHGVRRRMSLSSTIGVLEVTDLSLHQGSESSSKVDDSSAHSPRTTRSSSKLRPPTAFAVKRK